MFQIIAFFYHNILQYLHWIFGIRNRRLTPATEIRARTCSKQALLIASPFGELKGPMNDVHLVAQLLSDQGFDITYCCNSSATRSGILDAWKSLISRTQPGDTVFIYYSGHGGLVEPLQYGTERRYQFIVPMDYKQHGGEFRGILDVELSLLVQKTTRITKNVTVIFDCCHSGRIARNSLHGKRAIPKRLPKVQHASLSNHLEQLKQQGQIDVKELTDLEGNQHAVRIVAAADSEIAWEYMDEKGMIVGAATKALVTVMNDALAAGLSWKYATMRVCEIVNAQFPDQHPHAEGPYNRVIFSQETKDFAALPVRMENGQAILQGGQVTRVRKGNIYDIMPLNAHEVIPSQVFATVAVETITAFQAILTLPDNVRLPEEGALAFLHTEALYQWPITLGKELLRFSSMFEVSHFIRLSTAAEPDINIAHIRQDGNQICLYNRVKCASFDFEGDESAMATAVEKVIYRAEVLARAHHLLALKAEPEELLSHKLQITFTGAQGRELPLDGSAETMTGDGVVVTLRNDGDNTIFVSVFNVNVAGKISHLSRSSPQGIMLRSTEEYVLGKNQSSGMGAGMTMHWPKELPRDVKEPIPESFICFVSSDPVDLRDFERQKHIRNPRGDPTQLEKIAYQLSYGKGRDCAWEEKGKETKWDKIHVPFLLKLS